MIQLQPNWYSATSQQQRMPNMDYYIDPSINMLANYRSGF
jgi:hypothetical protein